ncbi:MAG: sodium:solute symporter family protein [ANME-2 cluster archaeon]|nr:sodium:solute symporter family protein [ANME-2 cluster archaeon]
MDGYQIFLILLAFYLAGLVSIGWYFTKKQKSVTDFWLAGREIGPKAIGFSAAASWLTAGGILAVIGFYMLLGMGSIWGFVAPNILALLIIALLVGKIKNLPSITQPELLEHRYSSAMRAPLGMIIAIVMILFAVADIKGLALVLEVFYGLSPLYAALIVALAVSVYVTLGGLSAVVWTDVIQFIFLAIFTLAMAVLVVIAATSGAVDVPATSVSELFGNVDSTWWNPISIGIPMVLIFIIAIIPGWMTEQDPWQRVWAARDKKSAQHGMVLGSMLILVVFAACAVIAIGLNSIYPEIARMGFPMGMGDAEPALLRFIVENFSPLVIALSAIGLAAAAMSCADTFATSGASCLSRDIYQRFIKPDATMKQMLVVNRISVLIIIFSATVASFYIHSIIDAIHIATFVASASYFFPLMGGLYWKRATKEGAFTAMVIGAVSQIALVVYDLANTPPMAPAYLETISPVLVNHGVVVGMSLSAVTFFGVSLLTKPSGQVNLAPFFREEAEKLAIKDEKEVNESDMEYIRLLKNIDEKVTGERSHLHLHLKVSERLDWKETIGKLKATYPAWVTPSGPDSVYRLTHADMLSCVSISRGSNADEIWMAAEPRVESANALKKEFFTAYGEVASVLDQMGIWVVTPKLRIED